MIRKFVALALLVALVFGGVQVMLPAGVAAQQSEKAKKQAPKLKAGKNEKVCNYRFPDGERRSWVCDKAVPCCAWDAIKYVKCGTTITGCL